MRAGGTQSPDLILGCHPSSLGLGMTLGAGSGTQSSSPCRASAPSVALGIWESILTQSPPMQSYEMPTALVTPARGSTGHLWDRSIVQKKIQTPKETSKTLSQNGFTNPSYHLKGDNAYNIQIFPEKRKEGTLWQQNQVRTG